MRSWIIRFLDDLDDHVCDRKIAVVIESTIISLYQSDTLTDTLVMVVRVVGDKFSMGEIIASYNPNSRPPSAQLSKIPLFLQSKSKARIKAAKCF